jgi:hypothetical protein
MFCNYCGAPNPDDASFCSTCGKASARSSANVAAQEEVSQLPPPSSQGAAAPVAATERDSIELLHHHIDLSLSFSPDGRWLCQAVR